MDIVLATNDARWGVLDAAGVYHWPIYDLNEQGYMREAVEPLFVGGVREDGSRLFVIPSKVWSGAGYVPVLPGSVVEEIPGADEQWDESFAKPESADFFEQKVEELNDQYGGAESVEPPTEVASGPEPEPPPAPKKSKSKKA